MSAPKTRRLALNSLETRVVPAAQLTATFDSADGVLRIEGTEAADLIRIVNTAGQVNVAGIPIRTTNSGPVWTDATSVPAAGIRYIDVRALAGNDRVAMVEVNVTPDLAVRAVIHGQQGHDTLTGGSADDGLYGGTGNDVINGSGGADHIEGGLSSDSVSALAAQLDRDLDFYALEKYDWENAGGRGEKWFYGNTPDAGYFILPNGEVYLWDQTYLPDGTDVPALADEGKVFYNWSNPERNPAASGTLVATLDPTYHQNLLKLANANVLSGPPLAQDLLGPLAARLDRDLGLTVEGEEDLYGGHGERWLLDGRVPFAEAFERTDCWYYILPNGELYRWDGNWDVLGGTLLAALDSSYYQDLTKLTDAQFLFGNPDGVPIAAWYPGEGNTTDATGGNDGTASGAVAYGPGRVGQAFQFSGLDNPGYIRVPNAPELEPGTVSVEAWVNSSVLQTDGYIVSKGAADLGGASYALVTGIDQGLRFYVGNGSIAQSSPDAGTGIWDGAWHHVVGTYDGSFVRLYVDGVEVGTGNQMDNVLGYELPETNDLFIGTYNAIPEYTFTGRIDEPTVYGRALNASEVQALFTGGKAALPTTDAGDNDVLTGGAGNDTAIGGDGSDLLNGGVQNDRLVGGNDNDTLSGNQGDDELAGAHTGFAGEVGNPNDSLWGGAGNDSLYGGDGADTLQGHNGNDYFRGDGGNDILYGGFADLTSETGFANDTMEGGDGSDELYGGVGADVLIGQNDNDYLDGGRGPDSLIGCFLGWAGETGNPNDTLYGGDGNDALYGGDGADRMAGQSHDDFLWGDGGNDQMFGDQTSLFVITTYGSDTIHGGDGDDTLDGSDGNDRLIGENGNDYLDGGFGSDQMIGCFDGWAGETGGANDTLLGSFGPDSLSGGDGDDLLWGGEGMDMLTGDSGTDTLMGEAGADDLDGGLRGFVPEADWINGRANDLVDGGSGSDFLWGGEGNDTMTGGRGSDTLNGESGGDWLDGGLPGTESEGLFFCWDVLDGGIGNDMVWGGEGGDTLTGGEGNDTLNGESGGDILNGGDQDDRLDGGENNDELRGGYGQDTLLGGFGHDNLYGEDGHDDLDGQSGRDFAGGGDGFDKTTLAEPGDTSNTCEDVDILNVPDGAPQTDSWSCGPNSASRVLRWYGINRSYEELRAETEEEGDLISQLHLGTRPSTLLELMRRYRPGMQLATRDTIPNDQFEAMNRLFNQVSNGRPVIALVHINEPKYLDLGAAGFVPDTLHWFVVTGFNLATREVSVMNTNGMAQVYTFDRFWAMWNWRNGGATGDFLTGSLGTRPRTMIY